ncbi:hypothetical protein E5720_03945 [Rhodococcus sp. PAMC28707]|uniref:hypothetical protein n=1 Tax=unclassified Rhodococcus (in: high G+C Gram-positive bacteria) TaxID=192944 RepID=UPI00109DDBB3|nr:MULTISPECIES: hypothetical protein [unclassified Rhodococcus (in: high G+C Gram-positive bacteria)]QCB50544.1 hypothetical protein E5769_10070 [Rhodococcus sp. PAMC28705]QCB57764.1 hypothetical protein E5720_03945 [Rhodococcus sp. PAMC28707]
MSNPYAINVGIKKHPGGIGAHDKNGRATVFVYFDFESIDFEYEDPRWRAFPKEDARFLPRYEVGEFFESMIGEILADMGNDSNIEYYTSDEVDEFGSRPWTQYGRMSDLRTSLLRAEDLILLVSVGADEQGEPTTKALLRLRDAVADAHDRFDQRVEEWYWTDDD